MWQSITAWFKSLLKQLTTAERMEIYFRSIFTDDVINSIIEFIKLAELQSHSLDGKSKREQVEGKLNNIKKTFTQSSQIALNNASNYLLRSAIEYFVGRMKADK